MASPAGLSIRTTGLPATAVPLAFRPARWKSWSPLALRTSLCRWVTSAMPQPPILPTANSSRDKQAFFVADKGMLAFFPLPRGRATLAADIDPAQGDHPPLGEPALEDLQAIFNVRTPGRVLRD